MTDKELLYHDLCHRIGKALMCKNSTEILHFRGINNDAAKGGYHMHYWEPKLKSDEIPTNSGYPNYGPIFYSGVQMIYPIYRSLSDLTKPIEHKGESFVPKEELVKVYSSMNNHNPNHYYETAINSFVKKPVALWPKYAVDKLIEWHFDIQGLIDKGLAIDLNSLTTNCYK